MKLLMWEPKVLKIKTKLITFHQVCYLQLKSTQYWQLREKTIKNIESKKSKMGKYLQLVRKSSSSKLSQSKVKLSKENVVLPGPSHINITDSLDETDESDMEITDDEKCCICKKFTPEEVRNSVSVIFTKWVKCDGEGRSHWAHLKYCTTVSVIRRGDTFSALTVLLVKSKKQANDQLTQIISETLIVVNHNDFLQPFLHIFRF